MTHTYQIDGMHCNSCIAKVKNELLKIGDIAEANVQLNFPQATISMTKHVPFPVLQGAVAKAGSYTIKEITTHVHREETTDDKKGLLATYKPLALVFLFITVIALVTAKQHEGFSWKHWMNNFMGGFFIAFSFFKLLDLKGFADSYAMYDIVAGRWNTWGFVYPFAELALGLLFISGIYPVLTNAVTFLVMTVSIIGVIQSVFNKRKIRCACLGAVFNLPMSTVTIIEDALMIVMSGLMLVSLIV